MRLIRFALVTGLATACAVASEEPTHDHEFELEPGLFVPLGPFDLKADLPNASFRPRMIDTSGYRTIANLFVAANLDVTLTDQPAAYDWPLADSRAVLNRQGTPIRLAYDVYEHTGLDVIRLADTESPVIRAPTSGTAMITDWWGGQSYPWGDYSTVISIWDPTTHHVLQLMHAEPDPTLPRGTTFQVTRGQFIGELADIDIPGGMHTHVNVVDAEHFELIDPVGVMPAYLDSTGPMVGEVYLLDEMATKHQSLQTGPLDLVVTAHDRDDMSPRNLEIESIAFAATDQLGNELARLGRCHLADVFEKLARDWSETASTIRLIDFGNATGQFGGFWPSSDLGNPDRLFRYAVTNLVLDHERCTVVANDRDGRLVIAPEVTDLTVTIEMWDGRGNHTTQQVMLSRERPAFIGDPCTTDAQCVFDAGGSPGRCHPAGFCTAACSGPCAELAGRAPTFCIADAASPGAGICVAKSDPVNQMCASLPQTLARELPSFSTTGEPPTNAIVCAPP